MAAKLKMVYLEVLTPTAVLAPPAVALQHLSVQESIAFSIEPDSRFLEAAFHHEAGRIRISESSASCLRHLSRDEDHVDHNPMRSFR